MTDDSNGAPGGEEPGDRPSIPPLAGDPVVPAPAAVPPPSAPAAIPIPTPAPIPISAPMPLGTPARPTPWGWIVAAILGVILVVLVILYFTGVLDRGPSDDGVATGSFGGGTTGQGAYQAPTPSYPSPSTGTGTAPTVASLLGSWGPGCPDSRVDVVTFAGDGTFQASGDSGTWSLNGTILTAVGGQRTRTVQWEQIGPDSARVTRLGTNQVQMVRRCY